jgi:alpha-mannosidase
MQSIRNHAIVLLGALLLSRLCLAKEPASDTCLMFAARNIAKGNANFFLYVTFAKERIAISSGDSLEYDIFLSATNPTPTGGVDFETEMGGFRDVRLPDQNGASSHPGIELPAAKRKWYHRKIDLTKLAGRHAHNFKLVEEGDSPGLYVQFVDNVVITHADGTKDIVYQDGAPAMSKIAMKEGYSQYYILKPVERTKIVDGVDPAVIDGEVKKFQIQAKLDDVRAEIELARKVATRAKDAHLQQHVDESTRIVEQAAANDSLDAEGVQSVIHQVHASLNHEHPLMQQYTGHLVGHAHIDFQWLWEWPETVQVCHDTFNQAVKFMAEFPGFKFSQSSSALYATTEEHFPDVFKRMQEEVAKGNWEIVGGRVCEGDENMISAESHARHFLYGQRYFRERFNGKMATVGWEPDTFGHTWQFPQILQLGGCKYFYFCRGGYGLPLFWWQSPDGSKVLAFEEPATGGWYNGDVTTNRFDRLFNFEDKTGVKEMLWVYGVGNHGGGPTRENINAALEFQKSSFLPKVQFSTATEFFTHLEKYDLSKILTHCNDMNTTANAGFYGVFTTHSDIKRWNRDAESVTESAEAIAAIASLYGFEYPQKEFRRNWEDITWNHHHDTLPGTSIHPSYNKSAAMFKRATESSKKIGDEALAALALQIKIDGDAIVVFNPTSLPANGIVSLPASFKGVALGVGTNVFPVQYSTNGASFYASNVPRFGYRTYGIAPFHAHEELHSPRGTHEAYIAENVKGTFPEPIVSPDRTVLENPDFKLTIDPSRGVITSIFDKRNSRESIATGGSGNRLEIHWEKPNGMSAWTIGKIDRVEALMSPVQLKVTESGPARVTVAWDRQFQATTIHQSVSLNPSGPPEFGMATEWKEIGGPDKEEPFLKVAFDIACGESPVVTYQIPFGTIEKAADNIEHPALKFVDFADHDGGAALINDCKHGYSAEGHTLRLSLIRTTYYPDPRPNDRPQAAKWVFMPHKGTWQSAGVLQTAEAFNHPLWATSVKANPNGTLPAEQSFVATDKENVMITGVKRAEDDHSLIVRFYEAYGQATQASVKAPFTPKRTSTVNFVEDKIADEISPRVELRGHEIRTLKMTP